MALEVSLLEEADLLDFVEADDAAMKDFSYAQAMAAGLPEGCSRMELITNEMKKYFKQDDHNVWLKVTHPETGKLMAGALWQFQFHTSKATDDAAQSETRSAETRESTASREAESFMAVQSRLGNEFKQKHVETQPHASMQHSKFRMKLSLSLSVYIQLFQSCSHIRLTSARVQVVYL